MAGEGLSHGVFQVFRLSGKLWRRPADIAMALGDSRLSDNLVWAILWNGCPSAENWHEDYIYMRRSIDGEGKLSNRRTLMRVDQELEVEEEGNLIDYASALLFQATWRQIDDVDILNNNNNNGPEGRAQTAGLKVPASLFFSDDYSELPPREILRCVRTLFLWPSSWRQICNPCDIAAGGHFMLPSHPADIMERLVQDIVQNPDCLLDGGLTVVIRHRSAALFLASQLPSLCKKLTHLQFVVLEHTANFKVNTPKKYDVISKAVALALMQEGSTVTQLGMNGPFASLASALKHPGCHLSRVDFRYNTSCIAKPDFWDALAAQTSISDLGITIRNAHDLKILLNSASFPRLLILRLWLRSTEVEELGDASSEEKEGEKEKEQEGKIEEEEEIKKEREKEGWASEALAEAFVKPECNIRFLDYKCQLQGLSDGKLLACKFWHSLEQNNSSGKANCLQALRIDPSSCVQVAGEESLTNYLSSPHCSLLWFECIAHYHYPNEFFNEEEEWELANSLDKNFSLCTLSFLPKWRNTAAEARANSFIRRNSIYKSGQLLHQPQAPVMPTAARLFLCGHAEAGKTTLCRMLLRSASSPCSLSAATACGLSLIKPSRTRGMEFHSLPFKQGTQKLVVCDLAGQVEYHAFHHFFMNTSNKDIFIVVCEYQENMCPQKFEQELQYWLKFIVAHKTPTTTIKPKVIVLVNFFYRASLDEMARRSCESAHELMEIFSEALDFGPKVPPENGLEHYDNLFGIAVNKASQVKAVKRKLGVLLEALLGSGQLIPQLCADISQKILPSLTKRNFCTYVSGHAKPPLFLLYTQILEKYRVMFSLGSADQGIHKRVQAALMELHNQGVLIFFPEEEKSGINGVSAVTNNTATMVITDNGWFCNKLVGNLLAAYLDQPRGPTSGTPQQRSVLKTQVVMRMLRDQGVKEEHLQEIIRYLQDLDLCYYLEDKDQDDTRRTQKGMLLFPALLRDTTIIFPEVVPLTDDINVSSSSSQAVFYGRRLRCKESSLHLIPSGVFTKLQVKLRKLCGDDYCNYLGYCWSTLKKGNVGAVVRFGADVFEPWENKQWVDTLVFCDRDEQSQVEAENLMRKIRALINEICQSQSTGIPEVVLEEWVLSSKEPEAHVCQLVVLKEKLRSEGLENCFEDWGVLQAPPTRAVKLLLPSELHEHVNSQLSALATIKAEFSIGPYDDDEQKNQDGKRSGMVPYLVSDQDADIHEGDLTEEQLRLLRHINKVLEMYDRRQEKRFEIFQQEMHNINWVLQLIRNDIKSLGECLLRAKRAIIANCSTRLLRHELRRDRAHPILPYLVSTKSGKLRALMALCGLKKARVHFMCESPNGPHRVDGQKGKKIVLEVGAWLTIAARVMVPALRVLLCAARIAATMALPASSNIFEFMSSVEFLEELGIDKQALQLQILSKGLKYFVDAVPDVDYKQLLKENELREAMQEDFALKRVCIQEAAFWVCDQHAHQGTELAQISNPFA